MDQVWPSIPANTSSYTGCRSKLILICLRSAAFSLLSLQWGEFALSKALGKEC